MTDKVLISLDGILTIRKKQVFPFPFYDIIISKRFLQDILSEFKKNKLPGDEITIQVVGKM